MSVITFSRRAILINGCMSLLPPLTAIAQPKGASRDSIITRTIPVSGERIPAVGLGTHSFDTSEPQEVAALSAVLTRFIERGGRFIDTAPVYGRAEAIIGQALSTADPDSTAFLATKLVYRDHLNAPSLDSFEASRRALRRSTIDLIQIHSLIGLQPAMAAAQQWKRDELARYVGITTGEKAQHNEAAQALTTYRPDFLQVDYSIDNREPEDRLFPLARSLGVAVVVNQPFGGSIADGPLLRRAKGKPLPPWAPELGISTWAQFLLKFVISHPAVTCVIPGTTRVEHLEENDLAGRGVVPSHAQRERMLHYWRTVCG